ncbi:hypothetical protein CISIN_1g042689mg [Citrus sinensis]|uniref:Uncharacterized protein n=1 Tax=Citrus sinensis TaxID=2711 RepID=A0A067GRP9_CITSI|nr:hypothetical protein CISIN_1g042689mg [Citrus sinensis]
MIKNNYQRVPDLHQIHLIIKVRVVRHAINKVEKIMIKVKEQKNLENDSKIITINVPHDRTARVLYI